MTLTVNELKKKILYSYMNPDYFKIPFKNQNQKLEGTVKFSFYKPTYYESDVYDYVKGVSIIIFKNDIVKTYVTQSNTNTGVIDLTLPTGSYFMYITGVKGCVISEIEYEFDITTGQETLVNINFDLAFYRATVVEDNDSYFNFSMTSERPCYYSRVDKDGKAYDYNFTSILGNGSVAMVVYDEKNNYKGKFIVGTNNLNNLSPNIIPPSVYPLMISYSYFISYSNITVDFTSALDSSHPISCTDDIVQAHLTTHTKTTIIRTNSDSTSETSVIEKDGSLSFNFLDNSWILSEDWASREKIEKYYGSPDSILMPQNVTLSESIPVTVNYGAYWILKDNLTSRDISMLSNTHTGDSVFMSNEGILLKKKEVENHVIYISQGNRIFQCSFYNRIADMVEQGKWIN